MIPLFPPNVQVRLWLLAPLVVVAGAGCGMWGPPPGDGMTPIYVEPTTPLYVDAMGVPLPGYPLPSYEVPGYVETLPGPMAGGLPAFPEPLSTTQPPPRAAPTFGAPGAEVVQGAIAPQFGLPAAETATPRLANPLKVPVSNHDFAWDQIVDVVSGYFPIASEKRVQILPELWTEGRIETPYQSAATLFEPQRKDSVGQFNLWQSTMQTIRRRAVVRVVPEADGYQVSVEVYRELEELPQPEHATAGASSFRNYNSLSSSRLLGVNAKQTSPFWIPLGRDTPLEQRLLSEIQARLASAPRVPMSVTPMP